jgi:hypothetical protein
MGSRPTGTSASVDRTIVCPQCGSSAGGLYCSACGTKLEEDGGLGEQIGGKLREPLIAALALLKTTWLVLFAPCVSLRAISISPSPWLRLTSLWLQSVPRSSIDAVCVPSVTV